MPTTQIDYLVVGVDHGFEANSWIFLTTVSPRFLCLDGDRHQLQSWLLWHFQVQVWLHFSLVAPFSWRITVLYNPLTPALS